MPIAHKTVISFGLVAIPIAMYTAVQQNDISFNQLHKKDMGRIKYKKVCAHCGNEVSSTDIIKGYQYDAGHYVPVTSEELEKIKTEKEKSIQILHFANLDQISPVYYDKSFFVLPEPGGDKAFELLRQALMEEQKVAIGKTVIGSHENLLVIIPRQNGLVILTMFYEAEIKEIPKSYQKPEISKAELAMAKTLINSMDAPFEPAAYHDVYQEKLKKLLEDKIANREIAVPPKEKQDNVIHLMEALKRSVEQTRKTGTAQPKTAGKQTKKAGSKPTKTAGFISTKNVSKNEPLKKASGK